MGLVSPGLQLLRENLLAERDRWALWLPVAMGTGVAVYFALPFEPAAWPAIAALASAVAGLVLLRRRPVARLILLGLGAMVLGFAAGELRTALVKGPMLAAKLENLRIEGRVREVELLPSGRRIELDDVTMQWRPNPPTALRLRLVSADPPLVPGDRIRVKATVGPPSRPAAPGAYDFRRDLFFDGIGGVGFALGRAWPARPDDVADGETLSHQLWRHFARLRAVI
jgi:competence protein ComEC